MMPLGIFVVRRRSPVFDAQRLMAFTLAAKVAGGTTFGA
jgi:hypothetical protein